MDEHDQNRRNVLIGGLLGALVLGGVLPSACALRQMAAGPTGLANRAPARPGGTPKPMIEEDIAPVLARLDAWYAAHLWADRYTFNPPATAAQLDEFERHIGLRMPGAYRQLYGWHDGETDDRRGHVYGLPLLPLERVTAEWSAWNRVLEGLGGNRYAVPGGAWPEGAVDPAYINPGWIPLTADGSGGHIGLDFDPWPDGRTGQVILFGRDEDVKVVLAESLGGFLAWIADLLESGNFTLTPAPGQAALRRFGLKEPPAAHFHEGARALLGAPGPFL